MNKRNVSWTMRCIFRLLFRQRRNRTIGHLFKSRGRSNVVNYCWSLGCSPDDTYQWGLSFYKMFINKSLPTRVHKRIRFWTITWNGDLGSGFRKISRKSSSKRFVDFIHWAISRIFGSSYIFRAFVPSSVFSYSSKAVQSRVIGLSNPSYFPNPAAYLFFLG